MIKGDKCSQVRISMGVDGGKIGNVLSWSMVRIDGRGVPCGTNFKDWQLIPGHYEPVNKSKQTPVLIPFGGTLGVVVYDDVHLASAFPVERIEKGDFEATWRRMSNDYECDWCGAFIYRNDSTLVVECAQRGAKFYCGHGCESNHREHYNSKIED